jgi:hypothetical protein
LDVSFVIVVIDADNVIISTLLPTGRASTPFLFPFPDGANPNLASTQHMLEHSRNVNANVDIKGTGSRRVREIMVSVFFLVLCWFCVIAFIMYGRDQVSGMIGSRSEIFMKDSELKKFT